MTALNYNHPLFPRRLHHWEYVTLCIFTDYFGTFSASAHIANQVLFNSGFYLLSKEELHQLHNTTHNITYVMSTVTVLLHVLQIKQQDDSDKLGAFKVCEILIL